jgi:hypothetical protein
VPYRHKVQGNFQTYQWCNFILIRFSGSPPIVSNPTTGVITDISEIDETEEFELFGDKT